MGAQEVIDGVALFEGDEEDLAGAGAPAGEEVGVGEEEVRGVGEGGAEEHGGAAAFDERDLAAEVEGDGGAVSLVAVEEYLGVGRDGVGAFETLDGGGEVLRGEHGGETAEGD